MNATWLLNLYPRAWRARYEAEFRALLDGHESTPGEMLDIFFGAVDAQLRPDVYSRGAIPPPPAPRPQRSQGVQASFFAHMTLFLLVNIALVVINFLVTPDTWWAPYVVWGWGMVLVVHGGLVFPWRGLFGTHLALYTVLNAGLVAVNVQAGGPAWSVWPVVTLGVLLATHALVVFRGISLFQAHLLATALGSLELLLLPIVVEADALDMILIAAQMWVLVLAHWLVRIQGVSLFTAHVVTFAGEMALIGAMNARDVSEGWWVRYPLVVWGVILATHAIMHLRSRRESGATRESSLLRKLGDRAQETPRQRRQRVFAFHSGAFLLGTVNFVLLDLMEGSDQWWAMWPIGAWLVLLALHAGWDLFPRRLVVPHLVGYMVGSAGLIAIDAGTDGGPWWFWPVIWWGVVVAFHAGSLLPVKTPFLGMHLLGGIALSMAFVLTNGVTGSPTWWWYPVGVVLFSLLMHAGWMLERSMSARHG